MADFGTLGFSERCFVTALAVPARENWQKLQTMVGTGTFRQRPFFHDVFPDISGMDQVRHRSRKGSSVHNDASKGMNKKTVTAWAAVEY